MSFDISQLLDQWDYQPGQVIVRRFKGKDGIEKVQLRLDLGLLQMNATGRPDGKRPFGRESLLQHYQGQLAKHRDAHGGEDEAFRLDVEDCAKLQQEAVQYHHRYICLYQLGDYEAVLRDTARNIEAFDLVERHAASEDLAWSLQQFRPQLLMMRIRAKAAIALELKQHARGVKIVEEGIEELRQFFRERERPELAEQSGEVHSLEAWLEEIKASRPMSERERLENALEEAVRLEDYEKAARVRDALRNLTE